MDAKSRSIIISILRSSGFADAHPTTRPVQLVCEMGSARTWTVRWSNLVEMIHAHPGIRKPAF